MFISTKFYEQTKYRCLTHIYQKGFKDSKEPSIPSSPCNTWLPEKKVAAFTEKVAAFTEKVAAFTEKVAAFTDPVFKP